MPFVIINGQQARIRPNRLERHFDELQLDLMRALEEAGIEVITWTATRSACCRRASWTGSRRFGE